MSNAVFPMLPGLAWKVRRAPVYSTRVQRAVSGSTVTAAFFSAPLRKWTFEYEFLRKGQGYAEIEAIQAFFESHNGKYDSFLLRDPEDYTVTDMGFGVGNGSTTAFQLQRAIVGSFVRSALTGVSQARATKPRVNRVPNSMAAASWNNSISGTGITPFKTADAGMAPDGTMTADRVVLDRGANNTSSDWSIAQTVGAANSFTPGETCVHSIWLRTFDGSTVVVRVGFAGAIIYVTVTPQWQRFSGSGIPASTLASQSIGTQGTTGTTQKLDLLVWGAQVESGTVATDHIPTTTAAVQQNPVYWPGSADGFEPVYTVDQTSGPASIYVTDWRGKTLMQPTARQNMILQSQAWATTWAGAATRTNNVSAAPDGTTTASTVNDNSAVVNQPASQVLTVPNDSGTYVFSFYIAKTSGGTAPTAQINLSLSGGTPITNAAYLNTDLGTILGANGFCVEAGNGYWRFWMPIVNNLTGNTSLTVALYPAACAYGTTTPDVALTGIKTVWGAQIELVPPGVTLPSRYIPTTTVAVTVTDYTISSNGLITFAVAPLSNAALSWSGNYFWRVGFLADNGDYDQFMTHLYEMKKIEMETRR